MHVVLLLLVFSTLQVRASGIIAGVVTFEDSGEPASDIQIQCVARGGSPSERAQTDAAGRYRCTVPPGVYRVRALLSRLDTAYLSQTYGVKGPDDEGRGIRVAAGARVEIPFVLKRAGTISGRILDDAGVPVRDATVTVYRDSTEQINPGESLQESAATTDGGRFLIGRLSPGVYRIRAEPAERSSRPDRDGRRLLPTWYPAASDPRFAVPVPINGDDLAGVDLLLARSRFPSISGHAVRADGSPASGLQIRLVAGDARSMSSMATAAGVKGEFRFESVAPGSYELAAGDLGAMASLALVVGESDVSGALIALTPGRAVTGTVRFEGERLPPLSVSVVARSADRFSISSQAMTDPQGRFALQAGSGSRLIRLAGLPAGWWLKSVSVAGRGITNEPVDLSGGLDNVDILVGRRVPTLEGVVEASGENGPPFPADAAVLVFGDDASQWGTGSTAMARLWPADDGTFVAAGLPAGRYHVTAVDVTPAGFLKAVPDTLRSLVAGATLVTLSDGETTRVRIPLARRQ